MTKAEYQPYDKSSKWLIEHHGDSMLRLAQVADIQTWRPAQAEVVQPRQLPDGLLEVRRQGRTQDDLFLLEVATYPERRVGEQLVRDLMLVYLDKGVLPEAVTLVLRPRGKYRVSSRRSLRSPQRFFILSPELACRRTVDGARGRASRRRGRGAYPVGAVEQFRRPTG